MNSNHHNMVTVDLNTIELNEFRAKEDPAQACRATFPLLGVHGTRSLAAVYIEIAPGENLGAHTDSAEELLVVLEGEAIARVGASTTRASKGSLVLVPTMVPHDIRNTGNATLKVLGVFGGANNIVATFEKEWLPTNSRVVDTSLMG